MMSRWSSPRRPQEADDSDPPGIDLAGEDLVTDLGRLHDDIADRDEDSIQVLLAAADRIAEQWLDLHDRSVRARAALQATAAAESVMGDRLRSLIELISGLPPVPDAPSVEDDDAPRGEPGRSSQPAMAIGSRAQGRLDPRSVDPDRGSDERHSVGQPPQATPADDGLAVFLFGPMRVSLDGRRVESNLHGKGLRVFRYLLAHRDRSVPKDVLIDTFWPKAGLATGRRGVHQAIYVIRKALRSEDPAANVVVFTDDAYEINRDLPVWCDVDEFELLIRRGHQAEKTGSLGNACDLYRRAEQLRVGDFIEDAPYEDWTVAERERLHLAYIDATNRLGDLLERSGDVTGAMEVSQRLLGVESCDEESHRRLMRCYVAEGHRTLAARQYRVCAASLDETYGLAPSLETNELYFSFMND